MALRLVSAKLEIDGRPLLGPIDLVLNTPGITAILGPNGAGKSLFLNIIHGLLIPQHGTVTWENQPAHETRSNRSYVFQTPPILRRSVSDNVAFPLLAGGLKKSEIEPLVHKALTDARLLKHAKAPAATLSGGERQRMAMARAVITRPQAILLDEPAANLDPAATLDMEQSVRDISVLGTKVIMATHDMSQAKRIADNILFFQSGRLMEVAETAPFFDAPNSRAGQKFVSGQL